MPSCQKRKLRRGRSFGLAQNLRLVQALARSDHVGYWLVNGGRRELEAALKFRPNILSRPSRWHKGRSTKSDLSLQRTLGLVTIVIAIAAS